MKSLIILILRMCQILCCLPLCMAPAAEPPLPIVEVASKCNCCDACKCEVCKCEVCKCKETGVRCSYDCACAPCVATYCCPTCKDCRRYKFPVGRKCEPRLKCPGCKGFRYRRDQKKSAAVLRYLEVVAAQRASANCST